MWPRLAGDEGLERLHPLDQVLQQAERGRRQPAAMAGDDMGFGGSQNRVIDRKRDHFAILHLFGGRECRHEGDAEIGANEALQDQEGVGPDDGIEAGALGCRRHFHELLGAE